MNRSMSRIGYARTSTMDQNPDTQVHALEAAGCHLIRTEQKSGGTLKDRVELQTILDFIHPDETLVVMH
ncbi:Resolvase, N terminal domain [Pseudovibrio ascidiaceicola]|uniref:Resolvase, N terminal domain n=1 Tax=Pseudovibrio ascidiaceicola TaxID=285279 RepID=A0A1I4G6Z0_9HYPH|nr:Resolvase, N terminal domain [Pseudovibrio ascidiaceicola]